MTRKSYSNQDKDMCLNPSTNLSGLRLFDLSSLLVYNKEKDTSFLCPVRALRAFVSRSSVFRQTEQLFVSFSGRAKGLAALKQSLSRWIVDAIALAYTSKYLKCPLGVRAPSTRGKALPYRIFVWLQVRPPSTFIRFYNL